MLGIINNIKNQIRRAASAKPTEPNTIPRNLENDMTSKPSKSFFETALEIVLEHEGGYVDHPKDPGGATNMGVTKRVYEEYVGRTVSKSDIKKLTFDDVKPIYRERYWDVMDCGKMPPGVALCVFDFGVNAGPSRSIRYLQEVIGSTADGICGPNTLAALNECVFQLGEKEVIARFQQNREDYYRSLSTFDTFGRGWLRRNDETTRAALQFV